LPGQSGFRDPFIDDLVKKFVAGADGCRTIDCILVRLSAELYSIEDYVRGFPTSDTTYTIFKEFLNQPEVQDKLQLLACTPETTAYVIQSNPRFKNLRPYLQLLMNTLENIECRPTATTIPVTTGKIEPEEEEIYGEYVSPKYTSQHYSQPTPYPEPYKPYKKRTKIPKKLIPIIAIIIIIGALAYANLAGIIPFTNPFHTESQVVTVKELALNPQKYVNQEVIVEGIFGKVLFPPDYCESLKGERPNTTKQYYSYILYDTDLEYQFPLGRFPDENVRNYYPTYIYRIHGVVKKYVVQCCKYDFFGNKKYCYNIEIFVLQPLEPAEKIGEINLQG